MPEVHDRFAALRAALGGSLIERDAEIDLALVALVAQEHLLLVGPPGTGKSLLSSSLTKAIRGPRGSAGFEVLLSKFSTPEELFGPVSVLGLKEGRYERLTKGYMPEAHVAFVDEVDTQASIRE